MCNNHAETSGRPPVTLYSILGVDIKASQDTIRKRYLKLAKRWHPDRHQGSLSAKKEFQEIASAFKILSDERQRQQYDLGLLDLLDVEDYLSRYQGLILTVCGLGMASGTYNASEDYPCYTTTESAIHGERRWMLTAQ